MLLKTNIRICNRILEELKVPLSSMEASRLKEGVAEPDKQRTKYESHHYGRSDDIERYIVAARGSFLQNDLPNAYFYLGFALHFIQDAYTSVPIYRTHNNRRHPKNAEWHHNYEQRIEDEPFVDNIDQRIKYVFHDDYFNLSKYSTIAKNLAANIEGKTATLRTATQIGQIPSEKCGKPIIDLNLALKASFVISKSVLGSRNSPILDIQLKNALSQHETNLRNAEIEASNKIIRLIEERDKLRNKKVPPAGVISKIKNWLTGVSIALKERAAISKNNDYDSRRHLKHVADCYREVTNRIVFPYQGWYNFQIPPINIGIVKRDLLSIQEIARYFGVSKFSVKELLKKGDASSFYIGNKELIRRQELNRILSEFPLNDFKEYPA
jgi:excisionase family DNA binding protein